VTSQKKRNRMRRHVFGMLRDAWAALDKGETVLAEKLVERATTDGSMNPRVWVEGGRLLCALGKDRKGERALRHAIAMAPTYGAAFAALADLLFERGNVQAAVRLQRRAVELGREHAPAYAAQLETFEREEAARGDVCREAEGENQGGGTDGGEEAAAAERPNPLELRVDWRAVSDGLLRRGIARIEGLVDDDAPLLTALGTSVAGAPNDASKVAVEGGDEGAGGEWSTLTPAPELRDLRRDLYRALLPLAAEHLGRVRREAAFPRTVDGFLRSCHAVDQTTVGVALGRFPPGGGQHPRGDLRESVMFPFAVLLCSSGRIRVEVEDLRPGRKRRVHDVDLRSGDAAVFMAAERLVEIAGVHGLQPVGWGVRVRGEKPAVAALIALHDRS
jgi:hypothetical protein